MALAKGGSTIQYLDPYPGSRYGSVLITYRTLADGTLSLDTEKLNITARLIKVIRRPTEAHSASWDYTIDDADGVELIADASCHTTNTETDEPSLVNTYFLPLFKGPLTLAIAAAGDGKNGVVEIFYER